MKHETIEVTTTQSSQQEAYKYIISSTIQDVKVLENVVSNISINDFNKLLEYQINSIEEKKSETLLHYAVRDGNVKIVKALIESGASVNSKNIYGNTPIHIAIGKNKIAIINELVRSGADISIRNNHYKNPIGIAAQKKSTEVINLLESVYNVDCILDDKSLFCSSKFRLTNYLKQVISSWIHLDATRNTNKELLNDRIVSKLWGFDFDSVSVQQIQQKIVDITNFNKNITLIEDYFKVDLSCFKCSFDFLIYFENSSKNFIHDNGIMTLSTLALLSLVKSDRMKEIIDLEFKDISNKVLYLSKLKGISKLFPSNVVAKLEIAVSHHELKTNANLNESTIHSPYVLINEEEVSYSSIAAGSSTDNVDHSN